ncbi:thioredoxin domain-containing protein [Microbacterium sp. MPKO10]|uniref:DsbA family protein n=1 Tax=Microbacterium sp. MPKO10 TaxID=2989818 RepID=UPI002235B06C|nr:thioredoxin domain-containing protein [Microbacterium sp. MPKO10]MCW4457172.1 thioredoxin domain-containing protein [Microbacterium sp. MPKO10]
MTIDKKQLEGLTKKERRELQREMARIKREADRKRRKRRKALGISGLILLIVAIIAAVGLVVWTQLRLANEGPENMASDGLVLTGDGQAISAVPSDAHGWLEPAAAAPAPSEGVVPITIYVDYGSKDAAAFFATNGDQLQQWATYGLIQLEIKPIALDQYDSATNNYSTMAANAAACAANFAPTNFLAVNTALLDANPLVTNTPIDKAGVSKAVSTALGGENTDISTCITDDRYANWVATVSQAAANGPLQGTDVKLVAHSPLVLVQGEKFTGKMDESSDLLAFISEVLAEDKAEDDKAKDDGSESSTETPAPTPTETEGAK